MFPEVEKNVPRPSEWVEPDWSHTTLRHWKKAGLADDHHHRHHSKCYHHHHHLHDNDCGRCVVIIKLVGTPQQRYRLPPRHTITITRQDDDDDYNIWSSWLYMTNKNSGDFRLFVLKKNHVWIDALQSPLPRRGHLSDLERINSISLSHHFSSPGWSWPQAFGQLCYNFCQNGGAEHFGALCVKSW